MSDKFVYAFGGGTAEGRGDQKVLLGGKGAGLAQMSGLGIPVPPGFTITTEACQHYHAHGGEYPDGLRDEVRRHLAQLEQLQGKRFGDGDDPLLLSVRSGGPTSNSWCTPRPSAGSVPHWPPRSHPISRRSGWPT